MLTLVCTAQNYAWGKMGLESVVGQIHHHHNPDKLEETQQKPFAELWMGDHVNGPSKVRIEAANPVLRKLVANEQFISENEGQLVSIGQLFQLNQARFMGAKYVERFGST